jgi:hypothetical protein
MFQNSLNAFEHGKMHGLAGQRRSGLKRDGKQTLPHYCEGQFQISLGISGVIKARGQAKSNSKTYRQVSVVLRKKVRTFD